MEIDASINQNFACITPREVESRYLFFALDFSYERLRRSSHGSNQEALNCGLVSNFPIPFVTRERQQVLVEQLSECDRAQVEIEAHVANGRNMLAQLTNAVFSP